MVNIINKYIEYAWMDKLLKIEIGLPFIFPILRIISQLNNYFTNYLKYNI